MTKQGTQNNVSRLATIQDLDALLARHRLIPAVLRAGGYNYTVRTDLTANEVNQFVDLMRNGYSAEVMTMLIGTKAERDALTKAYQRAQAGEADVEIPMGRMAKKLDEFFDTLPRVHVAIVSGQFMRASKALADQALTDAEIYARYNVVPPADDEAEESQGESPAS